MNWSDVLKAVVPVIVASLAWLLEEREKLGKK